MKLEPGRTSLSGRPEFLRPAPAVQTSTAPLAPRQCCMCGLVNVQQFEAGEPHNTVTVELEYLKAQNEAQARQMISPYQAQRGWRYKFHLGKFAMERNICRPCLIAHEEMKHEFARKRTSELKAGLNSGSYYLALCGD